jgi:hypothetical protein
MPATRAHSSWTTARTGRRGLFKVAGAAAFATAVAAACDGGSSTPKDMQAAGNPASGAGTAAPAGSAVQGFPDDQRVRVQHLLRRAGFAPSEAEVQHVLGLSMDALVDELVNPERLPDNLDASLKTFDMSNDPRPPQLVTWWMGRMAATGQPSLEKMTLFWHGFHTSGFDKIAPRQTGLMYGQNVFQRTNAFANLGAILKGISRQPAMMLYLDTQTNVKAHPNENFARELMELFSMGVGNYTEQDVREGARAFTGYSLIPRTGEYVFRAGQHDSGDKTFLGKTGKFTGDDVMDIIMQHPATPKFVARKAWSFFAYPNPDDATIAPVAKTFSDTGGDMRAVMKAILTHPSFFSGQAYRALVKSPIEYGVGSVRQLGVKANGQELAGWMQQMGQIPFYPPNVAGWPGGPAWMGSGAFLSRINGVNTMLFGGPAAPRVNTRPGGQGQQAGQGQRTQSGAFDVDRYLDEQKIATAGALIDHLALLLLDGQIATDTRSALVDYASGARGDSAPLASLSATERTERVQGTVYLIMAGPEYQLA